MADQDIALRSPGSNAQDINLSSGGAVFTLTADAGSFAVTGTAASLLFHRRLAADSGSYAVTGTDASLFYRRKLTADAGSFVITGTDASLLYHRKLTADAGSFLITGTDAVLRYVVPTSETWIPVSRPGRRAYKTRYSASITSTDIDTAPTRTRIED